MTESIIKDFLSDISFMQLATSFNQKPWLCSVWYVWDYDDNIIYFCSRKTRRHSLEIEKNANIAATFTPAYNKGLGQKGQTLTIEGTACLVNSDKIKKAFEIYSRKYPKLFEMQSLEDFQNNKGPHFLYEISPKNVILLDDINFPTNPRQEVRFP